MNITADNIETKVLKRNLIIRFIMLLSVFVVLLITSYFIAASYITSKQYDSLIINAAGLQRMMISQYTSQINQTLVSLATNDLKQAMENKNKADSTARFFDENMNSFLNGGTVSVTAGWLGDYVNLDDDEEFTSLYKDMKIPAISEENTRYHLELTKKEWDELKRISLLSLRLNVDEIADSPYVERLLQQSIKAVIHMDHAAQIMQQNSEIKLQQLDRFLLIMLVIGIVVFFLVIYFVAINIVDPLGQSITRIKQTSKKLEIEKRRAEKASEVKSDFLSSMSHELRTPMNAILGFAQMLEINKKNLTNVQQSNVKEILSAGEHLMLLINEVLDLSKIESGNIDVDFERVHLDDVIAESISIIKPRANLKNIEIIDNVSCNGHYVKADEKRLKQVLVNLLSNAEKYNSINGKIIIDCEYVNDIYLRIKITDSGNGIDEKDFDKLFMPFERLDKRNNIEGTGIGLVVTKRLVQLMCGTIGVESKTGEGSTFWVQFELDEM